MRRRLRYGLRHWWRRLWSRPKSCGGWTWVSDVSPLGRDVWQDMRGVFPHMARAFRLPIVPRNAAGRRRLNAVIGTDAWVWGGELLDEVHYLNGACRKPKAEEVVR